MKQITLTARAKLIFRGWFVLHASALIVLLHIPMPELPLIVDRPDWIAHGIAFGGLALLLGLTGWTGRLGSVVSLFRIALITTPACAILESSQSLPGINRHSTPGDLAANAVGVALGLLATALLGLAFNDRARVHTHATDHEEGFVQHARTFASVTLLSRTFGLIRDAVCAAAFGASPTWSAFVSAFVVPNVFRRLFGEGALSAAFLPEYARLTQDDPDAARRFATLTVALVGGGLSIVGVGIAAIIYSSMPPGAALNSVGLLTILMLPFAPCVCMTAILGAMLQTHGKFVPSAAAPILLNAVMIGAVCAGWVIYSLPLERVVVWLALSVACAGLIQVVWCTAELRAFTRSDFRVRSAFGRTARMLGRMGPVLIGLGAAQIGVLADTLIAGWPVIVGPTAFGFDYPLDGRSAASIYFGQRLYQLPLGVFVIALATAIFPALAKLHSNTDAFATTVQRGLRLGGFIAIPAATGLAAVSSALVGAIYGGDIDASFTADDARTVTLITLGYTPAIAFAAVSHVLTRAFYAVDQTTPPMIAGIVGLFVNLVLSISLMFPLKETGLALASSAGLLTQVFVLAIGAKRMLPAFDQNPLFSLTVERSLLYSIGSACLMGVLIYVLVAPVENALMRAGATGRWIHIGSLGCLVPIGAVLYAGLSIRRLELKWLRSRSIEPHT